MRAAARAGPGRGGERSVEHSESGVKSSGGPIQFGFFRANGTATTGYTLVAGIDNWQVTVFPAAPAPPPAVQRDIPTLGGTGLVLIALLLAVVGGVFLRRSR